MMLRRSVCLAAIAFAVVLTPVLTARSASPAQTPAGAKIDINSASQADLEKLPGIGAATAKKIIAGRPYAAVADLAKAGVPAKTIEKITPLVSVSSAAPAPVPKTTAQPTVPPAKIDLNTASQVDLEKLPGVGPATAKKIVAGRPYAAVADLSKAGVSAGLIEKLTPLVLVSSAAAAPATKAFVPPAQLAPKTAAPAATAQVPPAKGMVWVNLETKVYHYEGDQWYGKTKHGKFMTEDEAVKAGYRPSKEGAAKKK